MKTGQRTVREKRVLVTGASGGLGGAIARRLAGAGALLTITGRNVDALQHVAADTGATVVAADLASDPDLHALLTIAAETDVLVCNAALPAVGPIDDFSVAEVDRALAVNLRAPILLARSAVSGMRTRGAAGHVVLVASMGAKVVSPGLSLYGATKAGLRGFGLALREDAHTAGIGVSLIYPGPIAEVGMWADADLPPPRGSRPRPVHAVADAVVDAVRLNKAEIAVAPLSLRLAAVGSLLWPQAFLALGRRFGASEIADQMTLAHRHNR